MLLPLTPSKPLPEWYAKVGGNDVPVCELYPCYGIAVGEIEAEIPNSTSKIRIRICQAHADNFFPKEKPDETGGEGTKKDT